MNSDAHRLIIRERARIARARNTLLGKASGIPPEELLATTLEELDTLMLTLETGRRHDEERLSRAIAGINKQVVAARRAGDDAEREMLYKRILEIADRVDRELGDPQERGWL